MFRSLLILFLFLQFTFAGALVMASERSTAMSQNTNTSSSLWSQINWNRISNWIRPETDTTSDLPPQQDREDVTMPEGHWVKIVPYNECRDDGICPEKTEGEQK